MTSSEAWPDLPLDAWSETYAALHMMTQIVGKVRLTQSPWVNHAWHVTLYVTARGLTTSLIPHPNGAFQIDFDFIEHRLTVTAIDGRSAKLELRSQPISAFYVRLMDEMRKLGLEVTICRKPNEIADAVRFDLDTKPRAYDPEYVTRFWKILVHTERIFNAFRARFAGKCSPVHFFWGAPDLAVTRFSGRPGPLHPGGVPNLPDWVAQEAYSHEECSAGFWPGGGPLPHAAFYSYVYPEPPGYSQASVKPAAAYYNNDLREFILPYDAVRQAPSPDDMLLDFLQSTYEVAADLAKWDRAALEDRHWVRART